MILYTAITYKTKDYVFRIALHVLLYETKAFKSKYSLYLRYLPRPKLVPLHVVTLKVFHLFSANVAFFIFSFTFGGCLFTFNKLGARTY